MLTYKQELWLRTRGGRTIFDVIEKQGRLYVEMWTRTDPKSLVEIPSDNKIKTYIHERESKINGTLYSYQEVRVINQ